jgi:hypothetical protein
MSLHSRTFYVAAPATDAYLEWRSLIPVQDPEAADTQDCSLIRDVPGRELHWLSRWGPAQIDTRADFIPAQGGCVVHLNVSGIGRLSRFILTTAAPLTLGPWGSKTSPARLDAHGRPLRSF